MRTEAFNKQIFLDCEAKVSRVFSGRGNWHFLETRFGNFVWDRRGINTISFYPGELEIFSKTHDSVFVHNCGKHIVREFCGESFTLKV